MNMVRAGAVSHPMEWGFCGYHEIQNPKQRYAIINYEKLAKLSNSRSISAFRKTYNRWISEALRIEHHVREDQWSESIAVGGKAFVEHTKNRLGYRAKGRKVLKTEADYQLREHQEPYIADFASKKAVISADNGYLWDVSPMK